MNVVETTISGTGIRMRIADNDNPDEASEWVEFDIPLEPLTVATNSGSQSLGNPGDQYFVVIQEAALRYVRDAIDTEINRLKGG